MTKLFILALIGLGLSTQAIKADIPDLSDWVPADTALSETDQALDRAAQVILWANKGLKFRAVPRGTTYHVQFDDNREGFDSTISNIPRGGSRIRFK